MTTHTPGPWTVSTEPYDSLSKVHSGTYRLEGDNSSIGEIYPENHEANSRLIVAAPELLSACEAIMSRIGTCSTRTFTELSDSLYKVRAAIAKAKGEE